MDTEKLNGIKEMTLKTYDSLGEQTLTITADYDTMKKLLDRITEPVEKS